MRRLQQWAATVLILGVVTTSSLNAQDDSWQRRWYWGAQAGPTFGGTSGFSVGGHWMITGTRSALQFGFDALIFGTTSSFIENSNSNDGFTPVRYSAGRRLQAILMAIPNDNKLQVYAGGGFVINQITDLQPHPDSVTAGTVSTSEFRTATSEIDSRDTKAFLVFMAGAQLRLGRWALFGEYKLMPASGKFFLTDDQHQISGGLRFSLTHANETITTAR
ncbi:MAG: hypothetical protein ACE5FJ_09180 [Gemmatimonadales bacterium]